MRLSLILGIKNRSFYKLSKLHHPDANPNDPDAASTFSLLSESYTVLSDPPRRAAYDRDVLRLHQQHHDGGGGSHAQPRGSYHSAGGRAASGLSRRRTTFRGPPPSFYRSGGYGAHADKRRRAHEETTAPGGSGKSDEKQQQQRDDYDFSSSFGRSQHGGMGPGDDPFGHHDDVPHFDRRGHHRTQKREDERRWQRSHRSRRALDDEDIEFEPQMSIGTHFVVVIGLLVVSFMVPAIYLQYGRSKRKSREIRREY